MLIDWGQECEKCLGYVTNILVLLEDITHFFTLFHHVLFFVMIGSNRIFDGMCQSCEEEITVWDITRQVMNGSINFLRLVTGKFKLP